MFVILRVFFPPSLCLYRASQVALVVKNSPANAGDIRDMGSILGWKDPLEEVMATHSGILTRKTPQTKEPCGLQSIGMQKVK